MHGLQRIFQQRCGILPSGRGSKKDWLLSYFPKEGKGIPDRNNLSKSQGAELQCVWGAIAQKSKCLG